MGTCVSVCFYFDSEISEQILTFKLKTFDEQKQAYALI